MVYIKKKKKRQLKFSLWRGKDSSKVKRNPAMEVKAIPIDGESPSKRVVTAFAPGELALQLYKSFGESPIILYFY